MPRRVVHLDELLAVAQTAWPDSFAELDYPRTVTSALQGDLRLSALHDCDPADSAAELRGRRCSGRFRPMRGLLFCWQECPVRWYACRCAKLALPELS